MGVGLQGGETVAVGDRSVGDVAVQVEGDDDGDLWPDDLPDGADQVGLGILQALGNHGAVQGEDDAGELAAVLARAGEDALLEPGVRLVGDGRAGLPVGGDGRDQLDAGLLRHVDDAGDGAAVAGVLAQHLVAFQQAMQLKHVQPRSPRDEAGDFVRDPAQQQALHGRL